MFRRTVVAATIAATLFAMTPSDAFARHAGHAGGGGGFRGHGGGGGGSAAALGIGIGLSLLGAAIAAQRAHERAVVPAHVHHRGVRHR